MNRRWSEAEQMASTPEAEVIAYNLSLLSHYIAFIQCPTHGKVKPAVEWRSELQSWIAPPCCDAAKGEVAEALEHSIRSSRSAKTRGHVMTSDWVVVVELDQGETLPIALNKLAEYEGFVRDRMSEYACDHHDFESRVELTFVVDSESRIRVTPKACCQSMEDRVNSYLAYDVQTRRTPI